MKIISIDVGIKNLALCLFEKIENSDLYKITKWDVLNISEQENYKCLFIEKNKICDKPAKFKKDDKCFCLKHSKKQQLQIPTSQVKSSFINKQKINNLYEIADKHDIKYDSKIKKADLINLINSHINKNYFEEIQSKNASKVDLINIGINLKYKLNNMLENIDSIDYVLIENQISPIANRMKTIQGMIVQYFIMSNIDVTNIEFISASNKLKEYNTSDKDKEKDKEKTKYADRKKMGIIKCLEELNNNFNYTDKIDFFNTHKKKDDLADCFLQGIWFIKNKLVI
jgi:hypothetical protein